MRRAPIRLLVAFPLLAACVLLLFLASAATGSVPVPLDQVASALFLRRGDEATLNILWQIRLPRAAMAALLGGALSLSGYLLQTFFTNPIAGPFVLGISSGAKLMVACALVLMLGRGLAVSSWTMVGAAFVGALVVTAFVLLVSRRLRGMAQLLVAGIMAGYICSAATDFIVTFAQDSDIVNLRGWSLGSFSGATWDALLPAGVLTGTGFVAAMLLSKPMDAYRMGEAHAESVGVNVRALRTALVLLSGLLSACVTAFAGPISFVGIAVPIMVKRLLRTAKPILVMPAVSMAGAAFCLCCDMIARTAFAPTELAVSTVTSLFGAPVVIAALIRRGRAQTDRRR